MAGVAALATVAVFFGGIEPRNLKTKEILEQPGQRLGPLQALRGGIYDHIEEYLGQYSEYAHSRSSWQQEL